MSGMGNDAFSVNARGVLGTADTLRTIGDNHVGLDAEGRQARATTGSAIGRFFSRVASFFSGNASRNNQRVIDAMARQLAETSSLGRQYADIFTARAAAVLTGRPLTGRTVARVLDETVAQARADFAKKSRVDELLASFVNERSPDSSSFDDAGIRSDFDALLAQVNDELGLPGEQRLALADQDREKLCGTIKETLMRNAELGENTSMQDVRLAARDVLRKEALVRFAMNGMEEALTQEYTRYGLGEALRPGSVVQRNAMIEKKGLDKLRTLVSQAITEGETPESIRAKMPSLVSITARAMREVVIGAMLERASLWHVYADAATAADIGYTHGDRTQYNDFRSRNLRKEISREVQRELMTADFSEPLDSDAVKARYVRHLERYFDECKTALATLDIEDRNFVARAFRTEAPAFSSPALLRFSVDFSEEAAQAILAWKDITDVAELRDRIGKFAEGWMKTFKHLPVGEHDDPKAAISFAFALAIRRLKAGGAVNFIRLLTLKNSPFVVLARQLLKTEPGQSGTESDFNALFLLREIVDAAMPTINLMHVHSDDPDGVVDLRDDFMGKPPATAR